MTVNQRANGGDVSHSGNVSVRGGGGDQTATATNTVTQTATSEGWSRGFDANVNFNGSSADATNVDVTEVDTDVNGGDGGANIAVINTGIVGNTFHCPPHSTCIYNFTTGDVTVNQSANGGDVDNSGNVGVNAPVPGAPNRPDHDGRDNDGRDHDGRDHDGRTTTGGTTTAVTTTGGTTTGTTTRSGVTTTTMTTARVTTTTRLGRSTTPPSRRTAAPVQRVTPVAQAAPVAHVAPATRAAVSPTAQPTALAYTGADDLHPAHPGPDRPRRGWSAHPRRSPSQLHRDGLNHRPAARTTQGGGPGSTSRTSPAGSNRQAPSGPQVTRGSGADPCRTIRCRTGVRGEQRSRPRRTPG